jgi:hypothetical protein
VAVAAGLLGTLVVRHVAIVPDDEMAPTLLAGDLVLILDQPPHQGNVVAILDPLDPTRWTLRRAEGFGGAIRYTDGVFHTDGEPVRVLEMGRDDTHFVLHQQGHLVRHLKRPVRWDMEERGIADDSVFLGADARDEGVDSRWWGPVPLLQVQGVVVLRAGVPTHAWRGWVEYLG